MEDQARLLHTCQLSNLSNVIKADACFNDYVMRNGKLPIKWCCLRQQFDVSYQVRCSLGETDDAYSTEFAFVQLGTLCDATGALSRVF
jgi:hypothetical protein